MGLTVFSYCLKAMIAHQHKIVTIISRNSEATKRTTKLYQILLVTSTFASHKHGNELFGSYHWKTNVCRNVKKFWSKTANLDTKKQKSWNCVPVVSEVIRIYWTACINHADWMHAVHRIIVYCTGKLLSRRRLKWVSNQSRGNSWLLLAQGQSLVAFCIHHHSILKFLSANNSTLWEYELSLSLKNEFSV